MVYYCLNHITLIPWLFVEVFEREGGKLNNVFCMVQVDESMMMLIMIMITLLLWHDYHYILSLLLIIVIIITITIVIIIIIIVIVLIIIVIIIVIIIIVIIIVTIMIIVIIIILQPCAAVPGVHRPFPSPCPVFRALVIDAGLMELFLRGISGYWWALMGDFMWISWEFMRMSWFNDV